MKTKIGVIVLIAFCLGGCAKSDDSAPSSSAPAATSGGGAPAHTNFQNSKKGDN